MTYAYDNYVQLPVVDLYDTNVMKMAIEAAKDMYDKGQDWIKDFYKTYGDFMSPFAKDMEAYGQMMGGVRDLIDNAYANGIDLLKSPEGRMILSRAVNSVDPGLFNLMRSNAKTGYAYLDAMQKLRSQGKYSEAQELFDIMLNGGGKTFQDFATFDNDGSHVWDRVSPIEAASLLDLTYDSYKNRTPRDLTSTDFVETNGLNQSMFDPKYRYTGYLDSDLMKVAPGAAMSIAADPRAKYFRSLAEQKVAARGGNYTQADVDAQFYRDIADANRWALVDPTKQADEFAVLKQLLNNKLAEKRQEKALDNYYNMIEAGADIDGDGKISPNERQLYSALKLGVGGGYEYDPSTGMMVSPSGNAIEFTDYRRMTSDVNRTGQVQLNAASYILQMIDKELADIDLYNKYLEENRTGVRSLKKTSLKPFGNPMSMGFRYEPVQTETSVKVNKHSEAEMSKLRKRAQAAKFMVDMYKSYLNEDGSPNYERLIERGYFDSTGRPTEKFMLEINKLNKTNSNLPELERRRRAEDTYMLYAGSSPQPGTPAHNRLLKDFAGENMVDVPGLPNKMLKINLNHYKLSTIRRGDSTGANIYDENSKVRKAQEWLQNNKVEGYVDDTTVNDAFVPNSRGTAMQNDIYGEVLVDKRYIDRMVNSLNIRSDKERKELLDLLGIMEYEKQSSVPVSKESTDYKWITYYSVPLTKIISSGIVLGDRNSAFNKDAYGLSETIKRESQSYAAGIQSTLTGK